MKQPVSKSLDRSQYESELIRRIKEGDSRAFDEMVLTYQERIVNLAYRLLGDADAAQDVAQDAFVKAFLHLDSFKAESSLFTWLYRITVNLAISRLRKRKWERLFSYFDPLSLRGWLAEWSKQPDAIVEKKEQHHLIHTALNRLPETQRTVLVLHRWEGLSHQEIARILNISVSAVESRIHRAYRTLSHILPKLLDREA